MTARIVTIAEAIKDALVAFGLSGAPSVTRTYSPRAVLKDLTGTAVFVMPLAWKPGEWVTRTQRDTEYQIDVLIAAKLGATTSTDDADTATGLMDEILEVLDADAIASAEFRRAEIPALFDAEQIDQWTFLTKVTATYGEHVG